jgi:small subunit ribosomal protein S14
MAKKSSIEKNLKKKVLVDKFFYKRTLLKKKLYTSNLNYSEYIANYKAFSKFSLNSSPVRLRNRCSLTGRARGFYRLFGVSRIALRELAS